MGNTLQKSFLLVLFFVPVIFVAPVLLVVPVAVAILVPPAPVPATSKCKTNGEIRKQ